MTNMNPIELTYTPVVNVEVYTPPFKPRYLRQPTKDDIYLNLVEEWKRSTLNGKLGNHSEMPSATAGRILATCYVEHSVIPLELTFVRWDLTDCGTVCMVLEEGKSGLRTLWAVDFRTHLPFRIARTF